MLAEKRFDWPNRCGGKEGGGAIVIYVDGIPTNTFTGKDLAELRKAAGLTQSQLAKQVHIGRHAVSYWERKSSVDLRSWAVTRMREVLNVPYYTTPTRTRVMGPYSSSWKEPLWSEAWRTAQKHRETQVRVVCGAKTRMGTPCQSKSIKGKKRCKLHGGLSTGPRTKEGKQIISAAQKNRWKESSYKPVILPSLTGREKIFLLKYSVHDISAKC